MNNANYVGSLAAGGIEPHQVARLVAGWEYADDDEWAGGYIVDTTAGGFLYVYGGLWKSEYNAHTEFFAECPAKSSVAWADFGAGSKELSDEEIAVINAWHVQGCPPLTQAQAQEDDECEECRCEVCEGIASDIDDASYSPTNREKSLTPKRKTSFWCSTCDLAVVQPGSKCAHCHSPNGKRRFKK